jgi:hypothetical protein
MNLWIDIARPALLKVLKRVDLLTLNDGEARMLAMRWNLRACAEVLLKNGALLCDHQERRARRAAVLEEGGFHRSGLSGAHRSRIRPERATPMRGRSWGIWPARAASPTARCGVAASRQRAGFVRR